MKFNLSEMMRFVFTDAGPFAKIVGGSPKPVFIDSHKPGIIPLSQFREWGENGGTAWTAAFPASKNQNSTNFTQFRRSPISPKENIAFYEQLLRVDSGFWPVISARCTYRTERASRDIKRQNRCFSIRALPLCPVLHAISILNTFGQS